jgi:O-antigen/teichoic acid export membrane protein
VSGQDRAAIQDDSIDGASSDGHILATAKGSGFLAGGSLFEFACRFVIALVLARGLGASDYGLYVLSITAAALCAGIALIGLDDAMTRYVAITNGRGDDAAVWGTIQVGVVGSTAIGLLIGAALFVFSGWFADTVFSEPELAPLLRILAFVVPVLTFSNVLAGVARGLKRMDYVAYAENGVMSLVRLIGLGVFVALGALSVQWAVIVFAASDLAASIAMLVLLDRVFPVGRHLGMRGDRDVRAIVRFALPLWLSGMLRQFRRNIESLLLGALNAVSSVGIFAVASRVNLVGHVTLLSLLVAVKPSLAELHDKGDHDGLAQLYTTSTRWSLALNLPFFIVVVLFAEPLLSVFGESFVAGTTALIILSFAELANSGTGTCGPLLDMTGHTRMKLVNSIVWTVLLIGGGAVMIPRWGAVGAAMATLLSVGVVNALTVVELWVLERVQPYDRTFWKPLAAATCATAVGLGLHALVPPGQRFLVAMVEGSIVVGAYAGLLLLFGLAPEDRMVLDQVRGRMRRRSSTRGLAGVTGRRG